MRQYSQEVKGKLFTYFQQKLRLKPSTKGWYRGDCIYCDGKYSMGIHFHEHRLHCFKCGIHVTPIQAIIDIEGFTNYNEALKLLRLQDDFDRFERQILGKVEEVKPIDLPEGYQSILTGKGIMSKSAKNYLINRGFDLEYLGLRGVGYCLEGDYQGYIIFPIYLKGELVFFQGRRFIPVGPKMKNPPEEEFGVGKSRILYNQDALMIYTRVRLVESITNALTLGDTGVGALGKSLSNYQFNWLVRSPAKAIHILLDPDAMFEAINLGLSLCHHKKVKVVKLPEGEDVNSLGKKETTKIEKATPYMNYNDLFRLKLNYKNEGSQHTYKRNGFSSSFE